MFARHAVGYLLLCLCVLFAGCGEAAPEAGLVTGVVRVNGRTHRGLLVRFLPDPDKGNSLAVNATGTTDEQGKYTLKHVYDGEETAGAPIGWHRVLVEDASRPPVRQGQQPPPPLIPPAYNSPATTPLSKEIKPGEQTIDIDVKR
jgi:hypothetical protein